MREEQIETRNGFASWIREWFEYRTYKSSSRLHSLTQSKAQYERDIERYERDIDRLSFIKFTEKSRIRDKIKRISQQVQNVDGKIELYRDKAENTSDPEELYKAIVKHKRIEQILVSGSTLNVITNDLTWYGVEDGAYIGKYIIKISNSRHDGYTIENLIGHIDSHPHPYINSDGHPCLGDFGPIAYKYNSLGELHLLIDMLINYIMNPGEGEAGYINSERWTEEFNKKYNR